MVCKMILEKDGHPVDRLIKKVYIQFLVLLSVYCMFVGEEDVKPSKLPTPSFTIKKPIRKPIIRCSGKRRGGLPTHSMPPYFPLSLNIDLCRLIIFCPHPLKKLTPAILTMTCFKCLTICHTMFNLIYYFYVLNSFCLDKVSCKSVLYLYAQLMLNHRVNVYMCV